MSWLGKVIGGTIGFTLAGPLGAIAGAALGHGFDASDENLISDNKRALLSKDENSQLIFFTAAFSMLAKLVKIDGRISEEEISSIEQFMTHDLRLDSKSRKIAVDIFQAAKNSNESFQNFALQFYKEFQYNPEILELMIDVLLRVSYSDGTLSDSEEQLVFSAVKIFKFNPDSYQKLKSKYVKDVEKFHAILGCDPNDSDEFVKKQYRKLVNEYHPDKIAAKGLPEEFIKFASDKFMEIQNAYENVKKQRNL